MCERDYIGFMLYDIGAAVTLAPLSGAWPERTGFGQGGEHECVESTTSGPNRSLLHSCRKVENPIESTLVGLYARFKMHRHTQIQDPLYGWRMIDSIAWTKSVE
jgi:hypothetical protein